MIMMMLRRIADEWRRSKNHILHKHGRGYLSSRGAAVMSPVLEMHFLRLITDEGDCLARGAHAADFSDVMQMLTAVRAERAWLLTGTPTPSYSLSLDHSLILPVEVEGKHDDLEHDEHNDDGSGVGRYSPTSVVRLSKDNRNSSSMSMSTMSRGRGRGSAVSMSTSVFGLASADFRTLCNHIQKVMTMMMMINMMMTCVCVC